MLISLAPKSWASSRQQIVLDFGIVLRGQHVLVRGFLRVLVLQLFDAQRQNFLVVLLGDH